MPRVSPPSSLRFHRSGLEPGPQVEIEIDGRAAQALQGESVAAALTAAGQLALRRHASGEPRGLYCGMGVCFDCRVNIDGRAGERACLTTIRAGMRIRTGAQADAADTPPRSEPVPRRDVAQVLVVGAGPAGLAAAECAAASGLRVVVLDERAAPGGQFYKPVACSHRLQDGRQPDRQFEAGAKLVDLVRMLGVPIHSHCTVWDAKANPGGGVTLQALDDEGPLEVSAERLVVATGAFERAWPVPGWTLPGVMNTGAAQTLARAYQVAAGRRVLVAGNGPLNLQVAADLAQHGVEVVAVAEAARSPYRASPSDLWSMFRTRRDLFRDGMRYVSALGSRGVPLLYGHVLARVEGEGRAQRAVLIAINRNGKPRPGTERAFDVDVVCTGYGFSPSTELTRLIGCRHELDDRNCLLPVRDEEGRTSIRDVFVAGDAAGPWGAHAALNQGRIAGLAAARDLAGDDESRATRLRDAQAALDRETGFQRSLWRVFAAPGCGASLADDTTIACRCEAVTFGTVRNAVAEGANELATLKRVTRCGMGHCQGRYCSPVIARLLADGGTRVDAATYFRAQAPLRPVAIDALARTQPDIGAFAETAEPKPAQGADTNALLDDADTVVIGAGVVGLFTARELARAGQKVVVLERHMPHGEASGANAGSLHVQFQAFGFPDLISKEAVRTPVSTLAMQRDSVHLWDEFANEIDSGSAIEVEIAGGLAVADDEASLAHLRRKVEWERSAGLSIEMLSGDEARSLAPYLSPEVIAASLSRDEGKINPLKAAPAVLVSAVGAGVRVYDYAAVLSIEKAVAGFRVTTSRGIVTGKRVVNAAGAWSGAVAALAGDALPVRPNPIQMLVSEPAPVKIPYHLMHASRRLTLKQAANGNLIIGGGWRASWDAATARTRPSYHGISGNLAVVKRMLPGLGALLVIRSWTGTAFVTQPAIGESARVPGLFHAITQNGMTLSPAAGRLCADLVLGRPTRWDPRPFSPARFL